MAVLNNQDKIKVCKQTPQLELKSVLANLYGIACAETEASCLGNIEGSTKMKKGEEVRSYDVGIVNALTNVLCDVGPSEGISGDDSLEQFEEAVLDALAVQARRDRVLVVCSNFSAAKLVARAVSPTSDNVNAVTALMVEQGVDMEHPRLVYNWLSSGVVEAYDECIYLEEGEELNLSLEIQDTMLRMIHELDSQFCGVYVYGAADGIVGFRFGVLSEPQLIH